MNLLKMTQTIENPQFDLTTLLEIKRKIDNNIESADDYEKLDFFLSSVGLNGYIKKNIMAKNYTNYRNYIDQRKSTNSNKDVLSISFIEGVVSESIAILLSKFQIA